MRATNFIINYSFEKLMSRRRHLKILGNKATMLSFIGIWTAPQVLFFIEVDKAATCSYFVYAILAAVWSGSALTANDAIHSPPLRAQVRSRDTCGAPGGVQSAAARDLCHWVSVGRPGRGQSEFRGGRWRGSDGVEGCVSVSLKGGPFCVTSL